MLEVITPSVTVPVTVNEQGHFIATWNEQEFRAESFSTIRSHIKDAVRAARVQVPFIAMNGRRGVIRGFHASQRSILVTWDGGVKDSIDTYSKVFPGDIDPHVIEEIITLEQTRAKIMDRLQELRAPAIPAEQFLNDFVGENLTNEFQYDRRKAGEAKS